MLEKAPLPLAIDSSMLSAFRACPRKFYYNYVLHKVPSGESVHLIAGGAIAAALNASREAQFKSETKLPHDELIAPGVSAFIKHWGDYEAPENHAKSFVNTLEAFDSYMREFHPFDDPVQPLNTNAAEFSFAIPLNPNLPHPSGDSFIFCGRFDLLGRFGDIPIVLDEKTTGAFGTYWLQSWDLRGQFIGYVWACRQMGYPVSDAMVRGIAIQKTQTQFMPCPIRYSDHIILRWEQELYLTLQRMIWCWTHDEWSYNFADSCSSYGGCPYKDVCLAKNQDAFISMLKDHTWSPIDLVGE